MDNEIVQDTQPTELNNESLEVKANEGELSQWIDEKLETPRTTLSNIVLVKAEISEDKKFTLLIEHTTTNRGRVKSTVEASKVTVNTFVDIEVDTSSLVAGEFLMYYEKGQLQKSLLLITEVKFLGEKF